MLTDIAIWFFALVGFALLYAALTDREAVRLNLREVCMAKVGDSLVYQIAPTNAAGQPAPVFDVSWTQSENNYEQHVGADNGYTATLVASNPGPGGTLTVTATTKSGATLTEFVPLPDIEADEEAVALNLKLVA